MKKSNASSYSSALKKLISFTEASSTELAQYMGYDISYISKWKSGTKLPSSRTIERINTEMGKYFSDLIISKKMTDEFYAYFLIPTSQSDIPFAIAQYLSTAYRDTLHSHRTAAVTTTPHSAILTDPKDIKDLFAERFKKQLLSQNSSTELLILGDFCALYDAGFWPCLQEASDQGIPLKITLGVNQKKLSEDWHYTKALYDILNQYLGFNFTLYEYENIFLNNLIILNNKFIIQYAQQPDNAFGLCTAIDDPIAVQTVSKRFRSKKLAATPILKGMSSPWKTDLGYRTWFYERARFFFYLTNGIEYLLPNEVFDNLSKQLPPKEAMSIHRLRITWEEIINKSDLKLMIPSPSLIRYLETGSIDLTQYQYKLSPQERISHLKNILDCLKNNPKIQIGLLFASPGSIQNLSFYSNYKTSFFKKNATHIKPEADAFYLIENADLNENFLNLFHQLKKLPSYHEYTEEEISEKYVQYAPLTRRIMSIDSGQ